MKRFTYLVPAAALAFAAGCQDTPIDPSRASLPEAPATNLGPGGPLSGAIFTTIHNGTRVNANIYEAKEDVYLNGGPRPGAPLTAAGLPDGDYYFQVTDPSGQTLLSQDHIRCRRFNVTGGVIFQYFADQTY